MVFAHLGLRRQVLTSFGASGSGYDPDEDPDEDPDVIDGESRVIDEGGRVGGSTRRFSLKKLLLIAAGIGLLALTLFFAMCRGDGADDQQPSSASETPTPIDSTPTVVPTRSATSAPTITATATSAVAVPSATVRADTGDPFGVTSSSSSFGLLTLAVLAVAVLCLCAFFRATAAKR